MDITYLPVTHDEMPVRKTFEIDGVQYDVDFNYNQRGDFYTMMLRNATTGEVLYSGKLTYLSNFLNGPVDGVAIASKIIPLCIEDVLREISAIERISKDNFDTMKVCLI